MPSETLCRHVVPGEESAGRRSAERHLRDVVSLRLLILAALYESWTLPLSFLLGTPVAVFGAFAALWARGMENNIYAQIGLVMLIGLAAKNAS